MDVSAKASDDLAESGLHALTRTVAQIGHPTQMLPFAVGLAVRAQMHVGYLGEGVFKQIVRISRSRIDFGPGRQV